MKITKAIRTKSIAVCRNMPYLTATSAATSLPAASSCEGLSTYFQSLTLTPPDR
ncbi:hypothetical protein D3C71_1853970 [compost metagenome]